MTTEEIIRLARSNGYRADIGQFSQKERRRMDYKAKKGELIKARLPWPWLEVGTCIKTFYINKEPAL